MDVAWIVLGSAILVITLLDTFLAVLNYDEPGIFVNRLVRLEWVVIRSFTRRASRRWRPLLLRQVTGALIITTILTWIAGIVLGFTLIYLGMIGLGAITVSEGTTADFVGALYLSIGQFSTVGADNISPAGGWVNLVPVLETITSIVLLTFTITFFSNIYGTIQLLRSLCADFFSGGEGVGDPVEGLRPYFPYGEPVNLDRHLDELIDDFNLYCDSLRQTHAAYHFQSGQDQFSLPYALYQTAGVVGALRWGLPDGHPAMRAPSLVRLTESFNDFRERRYRMMDWPRPDVPSPVRSAQFSAERAQFGDGGSRSEIDPWTLRFLAVEQSMSDMTTQAEPPDDAETYARYVAWLPFASLAQEFIARTARDLDYQPIYRGIATAPDAPPAPAAGSRPPSAAVQAAGQRGPGPVRWVLRRHLFLDPGLIRFRTALRSVVVAAIAAGAAALVAVPLGLEPLVAGVFAGLIALFVAPTTTGWPAGADRAAGIVTIVPVVLGIVAGAFLPRDPVWAMVILAVVAAISIWVARYGTRLGRYGAVAFIAYYFTLLLAVSPGEFLGVLIAGVIGVACTWVGTLLPATSRIRRVRAGIDALNERVALLLSAAVRALSEGRDRGLARTVDTEIAALRRSAAWLAGELTPDASDQGVSPARARLLSLQVVDLQLAAQTFLAALPSDSDYAVTIADRAVLAGVIVDTQDQLESLRGRARGSATSHEETAELVAATTHGNRHAKRVHRAIVELSHAIAQLYESLDANETVVRVRAGRSVPVPDDATPTGDIVRAARSTENSAIDRRALQSGLSTGLALLLAGLVSTSLQYWAAMPAFQALSGTDGDRPSTTVRRLVGTVIGAGAAFGLALVTNHSWVVALVVLAISALLTSSLRAVASGWTAFWQTVLLATAYDLLSPLGAEAVHIRLIETIIGAGVAILVSLVIFPTHTRARVLSGMAGVLTTAQTVVQHSVERILDPSAAPERLAADRAALMSHLVTLRAIADPRRGSGSEQDGGVEAQVAALAAVLHYADELATKAQALETTSAPSDDWQRLDNLTRDNFAAALAVVDDRLPSRIHRVGDFLAIADSAATPTEREALVSVERVNQCLIVYLGAINPGSTDV